MIDELPHQLDALAATIDKPLDLAALHRRISRQSRRRSALKVGVGSVGMAAVVGGLFIVRTDRADPADDGLPAAAQVTTPTSEPTALASCDAMLAAQHAAEQAANSADVKRAATSGAADNGSEVGFKGVVTILAIDGPRLTFHVDDPDGSAPVERAGTLDAATIWVNGQTPVDSPPAVQVGDQVGLATSAGSDGDDHVIFIDIGASGVLDQKAAAEDNAIAPTASGGAPADSKADPDTTTVPGIIVPGISVPPGPTRKSLATITAVDAASITVTLHDSDDSGKTASVDLTNTPFFAGDTRCLPSTLTVGEEIGVAYHLDSMDNILADAVGLKP